MRIDQASRILAQMYQDAPPKEKALSIHLLPSNTLTRFGDMSAKDIAVGAGLPESYKTEIRKGINLAKYVEVKS